LGAAPSPSKLHWLFKPARYSILWGVPLGRRPWPTCLASQIRDTLNAAIEEGRGPTVPTIERGWHQRNQATAKRGLDRCAVAKRPGDERRGAAV